MQGQIDIKISKSQTTEGQAPDLGQEREAGKPSVQSQAVTGALIGLGKQVLVQGVQQFSNLSGNYAKADAFNTILSIGSDIAIASVGPVGVIAVVAKTAINLGNSFINQSVAIRDIELQRIRAGFVATQGSRYDR